VTRPPSHVISRRRHSSWPPICLAPASRRRSTSAMSSFPFAPFPYHFHAFRSTKSPKSHGDGSSISKSIKTYVSASIGSIFDRSGSAGGRPAKSNLNSVVCAVILVNGPRGCTLTGSLVYSCPHAPAQSAFPHAWHRLTDLRPPQNNPTIAYPASSTQSPAFLSHVYLPLTSLPSLSTASRCFGPQE
jgi:hypothetical protein